MFTKYIHSWSFLLQMPRLAWWRWQDEHRNSASNDSQDFNGMGPLDNAWCRMRGCCRPRSWLIVRGAFNDVLFSAFLGEKFANLTCFCLGKRQQRHWHESQQTSQILLGGQSLESWKASRGRSSIFWGFWGTRNGAVSWMSTMKWAKSLYRTILHSWGRGGGGEDVFFMKVSLIGVF